MGSIRTFRERSALLAGSTYYDWMGVFVAREQPDGVELLLPYRDEFAGVPGMSEISGGVIAALADVTALATIANAVGQDASLQSLSIEYKAVAQAGNELRAYGRISERTVEIQIVTNDDHVLIAQAKGTLRSPRGVTAPYTIAPANDPLRQPIYPN
jgi:acyl-coenzyme A thioesterase PaaI-like protein